MAGTMTSGLSVDPETRVRRIQPTPDGPARAGTSRLAIRLPFGLLVGVLLLAPLALGQRAEAAPKRYYIGAPWEEGIERGVENQRSAVRRGTKPQTIVERAARAARRDNSIVKIYLLARAHGVRAAAAKARAQKVSDPAGKRRLEERASADYTEALSIYREVLRQAPRCYFAWHDMGVLELQRNPTATDAAYGHFSNAYRINANYTPTRRQIVQIFLAKKMYADAIPVIQRVIELDPADQDAKLRLITCYVAIKNFQLAYGTLDPMVAKAPNDLRLLALRSHVDLRTGEVTRGVRAANTYLRLARVNPNVPTAFLGLIEALQNDEVRKSFPNALELYLYALRGLRRLERDPARRKKIDEDIAKMEYRIANPEGSGEQGPPTTEQLLRTLAGPDETGRLRSVLYLLQREEKPTAEVVRAIAGHITAEQEPSAAVRGVCIRALGRMAGTRLLPLVRLGLNDADSRVKLETTDTLTAIAGRDPEAVGPVIAMLGLNVNAENPGVSAAARHAILELAGINLLGLDDESSEAEFRSAFQKWWAGTEGSDILIRALELYHGVGDRRPDQILVPYLSSPDFYIFRGAYKGLAAAAGGVADQAFKRWFAQMPKFSDERLKRSNHGALSAEVKAWVAKRPGA